MKEDQKALQIIAIHEAPQCRLLGVDFTVLLPREKSEAMEVLWERYPKGHVVPLHQHKECEQFYLILDGEAEVKVGNTVQKVKNGFAIYIPRNTDHSVKNIGDGELVYVVFEAYPDGYLPDEPTWDSHVEVLRRLYGEQGE